MNDCICRPNANALTNYRTYGCRCEDARAANKVAMMRWRRRTGRTTRKLVPLDGDE